MSNRYFLGGFLTPHPPIIVPDVGNGREQDAQATMHSMNTLAELLSDWQPETIVLISPHAPVFNDYVFFYQPHTGETHLKGALRQFGDPRERSWEWDGDLQRHILDALAKRHIDAGPLESGALHRFQLDESLDHGALVPLYYLSRTRHPFRLIVLASAGIDSQKLFELGTVIRESSETLQRRTLLVASGDLSHKVNSQSPYGSVPEGERFDHLLMALFQKDDLSGVLSIDHALRERAAECGYRSIVTLCGALEGLHPEIHVHSYEAPFGIGYGVVSFRLAAATKAETSAQSGRMRESVAESSESPPVRLARQTIEAFIRKGYSLPVSEAHVPEEFSHRRAGAFVSLHKFGDLRGCIGTIAPTTPSLAEEIMQNAISAATADPRFEPVSSDELPYLTIHVDVLNPPEPVSDRGMLDPKKYGVIVEKGMRRGLLLPDLEGVDTVEQQLNIACRKGGIDPDGAFHMERFTVTRYEH